MKKLQRMHMLPMELSNYFYARFALSIIGIIIITILGIKTRHYFEFCFLFVPIILFIGLTLLTYKDIAAGKIYSYIGTCIKLEKDGQSGIFAVDDIQIRIPLKKNTINLSDCIRFYIYPSKTYKDGEIFVATDVLALSVIKYATDENAKDAG